MNSKLALLEQEARLLRDLGKKEELGFALGQQADILAGAGQRDSAVKKLEEAESLFREIGHQIGLEKSLIHQVRHLRDDNSPKLLAVLRRQEVFYQSTGEEEELAQCLLDQARALNAKDDLRGELELHERQMPLWKRLNENGRLAACYGMAAICLIRTNGDLEKALRYATESERLCLETDDQGRLRNARNTKALVLAALGENDHSTEVVGGGGQGPRVLNGDARARVVADLTTLAIQLTLFMRKQDFAAYVQGLASACSKIVGNKVSDGEFAQVLNPNRQAIPPVTMFEAAERVGDCLEDSAKLYLAKSLLALTRGKSGDIFEEMTLAIFASVCVAMGIYWEERNVFSIDRAGLLDRATYKKQLAESQKRNEPRVAPLQENLKSSSLWSKLFGRG